MKELHVDISDCQGFKGGWSLCSKAIHGALNAVKYLDSVRVLELGSGQATYELLALFDKLHIPFAYSAWENDSKFVCQDSRVKTDTWDGINFPTELSGDYDLVIIDGPNGTTREFWYPLLRGVVSDGTVILIDDFHHHSEFSKALNKNFLYDTISEFGKSHECWKTVKVIGPITGE